MILGKTYKELIGEMHINAANSISRVACRLGVCREDVLDTVRAMRGEGTLNRDVVEPRQLKPRAKGSKRKMTTFPRAKLIKFLVDLHRGDGIAHGQIVKLADRQIALARKGVKK